MFTATPSTLQSKYAPVRFNARNVRARLAVAICALLAGLAVSAAGAAQASAAPYKWYSVCVHTANESDAGTDSNVALEVRGTNGYTGFVTLDHAWYNDFETNSTDCYGYYAHDVQTINSVRVSTNANYSWKLAYVVVNGVPFGFNMWMPSGITTR
jgi:hypothetical protein